MTEDQIRPDDDEVEAHKKAPASPDRHFLNEQDDEVEAHLKNKASSSEGSEARIG